MHTTEVKILDHFYHDFACFCMRSQPRNRVVCRRQRLAALATCGTVSVEVYPLSCAPCTDAEKNAAFGGLIRTPALDNKVRCLVYWHDLAAQDRELECQRQTSK